MKRRVARNENAAGATAGVDGGLAVPVAAFTFAEGGPRIDSGPPAVGQHNDEIFAELGYGQTATAKAHSV